MIDDFGHVVRQYVIVAVRGQSKISYLTIQEQRKRNLARLYNPPQGCALSKLRTNPLVRLPPLVKPS